MEHINFKEMIKKRIIIWTSFSVAGVIAIPIMIVALVNLNWFVAIPCMALLGFDVIALPIGWTMLGILIIHRRIVKVIVEEQVYHVRDLSVMFGTKDKIMKETITILLRKRYLKGFKFNDIGTELVNLDDKKIFKGLCQYCGAPLPPKAVSCPHCNGLIDKS